MDAKEYAKIKKERKENKDPKREAEIKEILKNDPPTLEAIYANL